MWMAGSRASLSIIRSIVCSKARRLRRRRHLAVFVDRPEGVERGAASGSGQPGLQDPEQVVHAIVEGERIAFDIEEEVAGARLGQAREPAVRFDRPVSKSRRQQLVEDLARVRAPNLEGGLVPGLLERRRTHAVEWLGERQLQGRESAAAGHSPALEGLAQSSGSVGHDREIVVRAAPGGTQDAPAADAAVLDGLRVRVAWRVCGARVAAVGGYAGLERGLDRPVVGHVVRDPMPLHLAGATPQRHVHPLRLDALKGRELLHVRTDLEECRSLDVAGELGVHDLVAPATELAGPIHSQQEVRQAEPPAVEERGLIDRLRSASHRVFRGGGGIAQRGEPGGRLDVPRRRRNPDHPCHALFEPGQVSGLVLQTAFGDQVYLRVDPIRARHHSAHRGQFQPDEVLAGEEADQIRGREHRRVANELHRHPQ